jgi:ceramidase
MAISKDLAIEPLRFGWREISLVAICLAMLALFLSRAPIPQDPAYHNFADRRIFCGIPNMFDVTSNLAFLVVGAAGVLLWRARRSAGFSVSWLVLFAGTALVFFGSAYYHWGPNNATLLWDRLPMTIGFMGLFVALISEHAGPRLERYLPVPAVAVGIASAVWWHFTDDLRWYLWVQFAPLVCIPFVLAVFPARYTHRAYFLYALGLYVLAKLAEIWDREIYALTGNLFSGHTLKHLLAAGGVLAIVVMLKKRAAVAPA